MITLYQLILIVSSTCCISMSSKFAYLLQKKEYSGKKALCIGTSGAYIISEISNFVMFLLIQGEYYNFIQQMLNLVF